MHVSLAKDLDSQTPKAKKGKRRVSNGLAANESPVLTTPKARSAKRSSILKTPSGLAANEDPVLKTPKATSANGCAILETPGSAVLKTPGSAVLKTPGSAVLKTPNGSIRTPFKEPLK